eukprot:CCRYP_017152-RA/>CCRYP_017152-RA protein AED:0.33 eAED:0.33 QI:198/1/1/1/1/1/2/181/695
MTTTSTANNPETSTGSNADNDDLPALVTRRRLALHSLDYAPLAHERDVGGCCSALPLPTSPHRYRDAAITMKVDGSLLNTPTMDISGLHQNAAAANQTRANESSPASASSGSSSAVPEAGLHRDGEQARLVNMVRKRQLRQQQLQYQEMSTLQWINDSIWMLWDTVVGTGNPTAEETQKTQFERHEHYADIVNPYRDRDRSARIDHDQDIKTGRTNQLGSLEEERKVTFHHSTSTLLQSRPTLIRVAIYIYQRQLYALRWIIDVVVTKTTTAIRSCPENASSEIIRSYVHSPSYSLHFTADDIIMSIILLWIGMFLGCRSQRVIVPVIVLIVMFGLVFLPKINGHIATLESRSMDHYFIRQQQKQPVEKFDVQTRDTDLEKTAAKTSIVSRSVISKDTPQHLQAIQRLKQRFPNATYAECKRFFVCAKHVEEEAAQRIECWLQWRSDCGLKLTADENYINTARVRSQEYNQGFVKQDEEVWNHAATLAMQIESKGASVDTSVKLPQILCSYEEQLPTSSTTNADSNNPTSTQPPPRAKDSTRIFYILPARIDLTLSPAPTYSLACALYLDRRLCRTNTEKITLLCDVRGGRGWANPTPWSMLPFIQATSSLLGKQYPERLEKFILFPMPSAAAWIWSAAQKCLDPNTASKVVVVGVEDDGKSGGGLPEKLKEFIDGESLTLVEERRRSLFGLKTS